MKHVIVFVEHRQGQTRKVTFELATEARRLADTLGGKACAVVLGEGAGRLAEQLKSYPLDTIYVSEDRDVDAYLFDPSVDYLQSAAQIVGPSLILIPNTLSGRDVAGRLMVRLGAGIVADVVDVQIDGGEVDLRLAEAGRRFDYELRAATRASTASQRFGRARLPRRPAAPALRSSRSRSRRRPTRPPSSATSRRAPAS